MMDLYLSNTQLFTSRVDYRDVFISCLDPNSDGTHSLQRIHWWASDLMLNFSKSVPMKKQTHLHLGWPEGEYIELIIIIRIINWTIPFKSIKCHYFCLLLNKLIYLSIKLWHKTCSAEMIDISNYADFIQLFFFICSTEQVENNHENV